MTEKISKISNIGFYYQKEYFRSLTFDSTGNFKKDKVIIDKVAARNEALLKGHQLENSWFVNQPEPNSYKVKSLYPGIVTGIGMKHETGIEGELKLGLYFDYSSGMPCIPASSVKGALRSAFPQWSKHSKTPVEIKRTKTIFIESLLANIDFDKIDYYEEQNLKNKISVIEEEIFEGKRNGNYICIYEKDIFHDAYITKSDSKGRILADDAITPHGANPLKNPNPVLFLKIASGVTIQFNFDLKDSGIRKTDGAPLLTKVGKLELFKAIITTLGIGAKTNVGYGQFDKAPATVAHSQLDKKTDVEKFEQPDNTSINDELTEPSKKVRDQLTKGSEWPAQVYRIKKDNCLLKISVDGEDVIIKKKIDKINFEVKVADNVTVIFNANYSNTPDFRVAKLS